MLIEKIKNKENGIVLYGITPPRLHNSPEKLKKIATRQIRRLRQTDIDGLIVYDIQDEKDRTPVERPFPFMETHEAYDYCENYLHSLPCQKIIYRAVGKYSEQNLRQFVETVDPKKILTVFVGASSKRENVNLTLNKAYRIKHEVKEDLVLGGVVIPERHKTKVNEHIRVFDKIKRGCLFFVSQGVYDLAASKNFLSDYYYYALKNNLPLVPIIFTFTPCGSAKTLEFMKWLGISVPRWLENELLHSHDILEKSIDLSEKLWYEIKEFAQEKNIPVGCNIESASIRKVEIEASVEMLKKLR